MNCGNAIQPIASFPELSDETLKLPRRKEPRLSNLWGRSNSKKPQQEQQLQHAVPIKFLCSMERWAMATLISGHVCFKNSAGWLLPPRFRDGACHHPIQGTRSNSTPNMTWCIWQITFLKRSCFWVPLTVVAGVPSALIIRTTNCFGVLESPTAVSMPLLVLPTCCLLLVPVSIKFQVYAYWGPMVRLMILP